MKRMRSAVWILLILFGVVCYSAWMVRDTTHTLLAQMEQVENLCQAGEYDNAAGQLAQMNAYYEKREHLLALFIKRDYLSSIAVSLGGLSAYATPDNRQDLSSEIGKAKAQLLTVEHLFFSLL